MKIHKILVLIICLAASHVSAQALVITPPLSPLERGSTIVISPKRHTQYVAVQYLDVHVTAEKYLGDSILVIDVKTPQTIDENTLSFKLKRNGYDFIAENYLEIINGRYNFNIPDIKEGEKLIFSVGFYRARTFQMRAKATFISPEAPVRHKIWKGDYYKY